MPAHDKDTYDARIEEEYRDFCKTSKPPFALCEGSGVDAFKKYLNGTDLPPHEKGHKLDVVMRMCKELKER